MLPTLVSDFRNSLGLAHSLCLNDPNGPGKIKFLGLSLSLSSPCIRPLVQDGMTDISTTMGVSQQMGISEVRGTGSPLSGAGRPVLSHFAFLFPNFVFHQVKEFDWLPTSLPRHCRIILSTSRADLTYRSLCDRGDVEVVTLPGVKDNSLIMSYLKTVVKRHALPFVQTKERYVSGYAVFQVWYAVFQV